MGLTLSPPFNWGLDNETGTEPDPLVDTNLTQER